MIIVGVGPDCVMSCVNCLLARCCGHSVIKGVVYAALTFHCSATLSVLFVWFHYIFTYYI